MNQNISDIKESPVRFMILSAMFSAIVYVFTRAINIQLPGMGTGGLIHLGSFALFVISVIFGKYYGAVSGALGMGIFDLFSPYFMWTPGTVIIRGIMGFMIGSIANGKEGKTSYVRIVLALVLSSIWMIAGYFGYSLMVFRNLPVSLSSVTGDLMQVGGGMVLALPVILISIKSGTTKYLRRQLKATA